MDTVGQIVNSSVDLIRKYGVRSVTMDEIASECGMSKKTIYQHFDDKDQLIRSIVSKIIEDIQSRMNERVQKAENAIQEYFLGIGDIREIVGSLNHNIIHDLRKYHPKAYEMVSCHKIEFFYQYLQNNLKRGLKEGLYREDVGNKLDLLPIILLNTFNSNTDVTHPGHFNYDIQEMFETASIFMVRGLVNEKGLKILEKYKTELGSVRTK